MVTAADRKGRGWLCTWALVLPLPTLALVASTAAFVGTSFHSPRFGGTVALLLFGAVAAKAWRDGPQFFAAFMVGVALLVAAALGLFLYALAHMGPMG